MQNIVLTVHLILAFSLIIVVLLQRSEGGGLGIGGGGGGGGVMSGRSAATALTKLTWGLGIAFVVTSITLTVISARNSGADSVLDTLGIESTGGPAIPDPQLGDVTAPPPAPAPAPLVEEGPATPPPVQ